MFCVPIKLFISAWRPDTSSFPISQMSLSTSWWLLCLQRGGGLSGRMGQEQDSYPPAWTTHGIKALRSGGDQLLCGGHWMWRRIHSCCLLERSIRERNRKKADWKCFQGIQLVGDALQAGLCRSSSFCRENTMAAKGRSDKSD